MIFLNLLMYFYLLFIKKKGVTCLNDLLSKSSLTQSQYEPFIFLPKMPQKISCC